MQASSAAGVVPCQPSKAAAVLVANIHRPGVLRRSCCWAKRRGRGRGGFKSIRAIEGSSDLPPVEVTWQIAVGALAGVTPFAVAGIEFSKRIVAQRKCEVCGGSGLVEQDGLYGRCPGCGGFLPWQSWKRFFTG